MSHLSIASFMVLLWMVGTSVFSNPARSSSASSAKTPPARCTSSIWYFCEAGATFARQGTPRLKRSISAILKSISASLAAASRCNIVLVEPPMAMSKLMAFSKAALVAIERGNTESSSCS